MLNSLIAWNDIKCENVNYYQRYGSFIDCSDLSYIIIQEHHILYIYIKIIQLTNAENTTHNIEIPWA